MDVPPYTTVQGDRARLTGLNLEGLKRSDVSPGAISALKKVYKILFRSGLVLEEALKRVKADVQDYPEVDAFVAFVTGSVRGVTR